MGDPGLGPVRLTGWMQRVAEQDEGRVRGVRLGRGEARDATAVRVAADDGRGFGGHDGVERRDGVLGAALGQVDGDRLDTPRPQPVHERRHARRRAAGTVTRGSRSDPSAQRRASFPRATIDDRPPAPLPRCAGPAWPDRADRLRARRSPRPPTRRPGRSRPGPRRHRARRPPRRHQRRLHLHRHRRVRRMPRPATPPRSRRRPPDRWGVGTRHRPRHRPGPARRPSGRASGSTGAGTATASA